jgi:hypothetical protein
LVVSTIHTTFTSHSGAADDDSRQDFQPPTDDGGTITMSFFHRYTVSRVSGDTDVLVKALDEHGTPIAQGLTTANIVKDEATAVTVAIALIPASGGDGGDNDAGTETDSGTPSDGAIDLSLDLSPDL